VGARNVTFAAVLRSGSMLSDHEAVALSVRA